MGNTALIERWEYNRLDDPTEEQLEVLGLSGWDLVSVSTFEVGGGAVINGMGGERYRVHFRHTFKRPARQRCPGCKDLVRMDGGACTSCGTSVEPHPNFLRVQGLLADQEQGISDEQLAVNYGISFKWNLYHWNRREFKSLSAAIEAARAAK